MNFGGYDLGDYELLGIPDFGGIALWRWVCAFNEKVIRRKYTQTKIRLDE